MSGLFNLPPRATKAGDSLLAKKANKTTKASAGVIIKGGGGLLERIATINAMVNKNLGKYADDYIVIREKNELKKYIDKSIANGILSIDTETNSLDPMICMLAGVCLYTPGMKAAYIPVHHVSYVTGIEVENQLAEDFIKGQIERVRDAKTKLIFFNAKFDIRVIKNKLGVELFPYWDGYIAARLLNENEPANNLKTLHNKYCLGGKGDAFTFESLFSGIPFTHIPINTGYLYAARDAEITYELFEFQRPFLTADDPVCIERDLTGPAFVFREIELPLVNVVADMEDTGVAFDFEYAKKLSKKYNDLLAKKEAAFYSVCDKFGDKIEAYRAQKGASNKLANPVNIASPQQIAILLYDILKITPPDKEKPRGTGVDILEQIDHPIAKTILGYRGVAVLLGTFIDKLPLSVNPNTGRIHASFNQMGTDTGRFSSSDPNMQNIPAHNKDIRKMFTATEGYVLLSSDYSAQEPRITAHMSKDEKMIKAYNDGKDLYVEIASLAFGLPYDECQEFRADGTTNSEGKARRGTAKAIVLGVCYGKGVPAIAEDLKITRKKAQGIYDKIMMLFPGLESFMVDSENMARELGFVDTLWGRKRRLPNMQLEQYEFSYIGGMPTNFDPLFDDDADFDMVVSEDIKRAYTQALNRSYGRKEKEAIKAKAKAEGIMIKDNGGYIAEATRQCVNSRIQGSAADQTKIAMILVSKDERLKELGFRLLLAVHDELIGECPEENVKEVAPRFAQLMVDAAKDLVVPSKCDIIVTKMWYGEPLEIN